MKIFLPEPNVQRPDHRRTLNWVLELPHLPKKSKAAEGIEYNFYQVRMMLWKAQRCFRKLSSFLSVAHDEKKLFQAFAKQMKPDPNKPNEPAVDTTDYDLALGAHQMARTFALRNLDLDQAPDLMLAAFIYTVDLGGCACESYEICKALKDQEDADEEAGKKVHKHIHKQKPTDSEAHGKKMQPWSIVNWCLRVGQDSKKEEVRTKCRQTLADVYEPFVDRMDECLMCLPHKRDVLFRGIDVPVATEYSLDTAVCFPAFTSTSTKGTEAEKFMQKDQDGTFFILRIHSAAMIDFLSHFPDQKEALCPTYTSFTVKNKSSRTLMQLLGCRYDIVTMTEMFGEHKLHEKAQWIYESALRTVFIYENYLDKYVEGRVATQPPPQREQDCVLIFNEIDEWLLQPMSHQPYMFLLGSGGSGKTSATLGCLATLMRHAKMESVRREKPILPLFISLPAVEGLFNEDGKPALDLYLQKTLDLDTPEGLRCLSDNYTVVLLLDSLDEVPLTQEQRDDLGYFFAINPWAQKQKCLVSCREEFFDQSRSMRGPNLLLSPMENEVRVRYVQPFTIEDVATFVFKNIKHSKKDNKDLLESGDVDKKTGKFSKKLVQQVSEEANNAYRRLTQLGVDMSVLRHPCTTYIALQATIRARDFLPENNGSTITDIYEAFLADAVRPIYELEENKGDQKARDLRRLQVFRGLETVALSMVSSNFYEASVGDFLGMFDTLFPDAKKGESEKNSDVRRKILSCTPRRCDNDFEDTCMMSFWHKSIPEYLAARALFRNPHDMLIRVNSNFSLNTPMILRFFENLSTGTTNNRKHFVASTAELLQYVYWQCKDHPIKDEEYFESARQDLLKTPNLGSKAFQCAGSNAMALLVAGRFVFDKDSDPTDMGANFKGLCLNHCNMTGAHFHNCSLQEATFAHCDISRVEFRGSDVGGLDAETCATDIQKLPIQPFSFNSSGAEVQQVILCQRPDLRLLLIVTREMMLFYDIDTPDAPSAAVGGAFLDIDNDFKSLIYIRSCGRAKGNVKGERNFNSVDCCPVVFSSLGFKDGNWKKKGFTPEDSLHELIYPEIFCKETQGIGFLANLITTNVTMKLNLKGDVEPLNVKSPVLFCSGGSLINNGSEIALSIVIQGEEWQAGSILISHSAARFIAYSGVLVFDVAQVKKSYNVEDALRVYETKSGFFPKWVVTTQENKHNLLRGPYSTNWIRAPAQVLKLSNKEAPKILPDVSDVIRDIANGESTISRDGHHVAHWGVAAGASTVSLGFVSDSGEYAKQHDFDHGGNKPSTATFSLTGKELIVGAGDSLFVWDVAGRNLLAQRTLAYKDSVTHVGYGSISLFVSVSKGKNQVDFWGNKGGVSITSFNCIRPKVVHVAGNSKFKMVRANVENRSKERLSVYDRSVAWHIETPQRHGVEQYQLPRGAATQRENTSNTVVHDVSVDNNWALIGDSGVSGAVRVNRTTSNTTIKTLSIEKIYVRESRVISGLIGEHQYQLPDKRVRFKNGKPVLLSASFSPCGKYFIFITSLKGECASAATSFFRQITTDEEMMEEDPEFTVLDLYSMQTYDREEQYYIAQNGTKKNWVAHFGNGAFAVCRTNPDVNKQNDVTDLKLPKPECWDVFNKKVAAAPKCISELTLGSFSLSSDGKHIAKWDDKSFTVHEIFKDNQLFKKDLKDIGFTDDKMKVTQCSWSKVQNQLLALVGNEIISVDGKSGAKIGTVKVPCDDKHLPRAVASHDGERFVAICDDGVAHYVKQDTELWSFGPLVKEGHSRTVTSVAYLALRHQVVTGGEDGQIILWDLDRCREVQRLSLDEPILQVKVCSAKGQFWVVAACAHSITISDFKHRYNRIQTTEPLAGDIEVFFNRKTQLTTIVASHFIGTVESSSIFNFTKQEVNADAAFLSTAGELKMSVVSVNPSSAHSKPEVQAPFAVPGFFKTRSNNHFKGMTRERSTGLLWTQRIIVNEGGEYFLWLSFYNTNTDQLGLVPIDQFEKPKPEELKDQLKVLDKNTIQIRIIGKGKCVKKAADVAVTCRDGSRFVVSLPGDNPPIIHTLDVTVTGTNSAKLTQLSEADSKKAIEQLKDNSNKDAPVLVHGERLAFKKTGNTVSVIAGEGDVERVRDVLGTPATMVATDHLGMGRGKLLEFVLSEGEMRLAAKKRREAMKKKEEADREAAAKRRGPPGQQQPGAPQQQQPAQSGQPPQQPGGVQEPKKEDPKPEDEIDAEDLDLGITGVVCCKAGKEHPNGEHFNDMSYKKPTKGSHNCDGCGGNAGPIPRDAEDFDLRWSGALTGMLYCGRNDSSFSNCSDYCIKCALRDQPWLIKTKREAEARKKYAQKKKDEEERKRKKKEEEEKKKQKAAADAKKKEEEAKKKREEEKKKKLEDAKKKDAAKKEEAAKKDTAAKKEEKPASPKKEASSPKKDDKKKDAVKGKK